MVLNTFGKRLKFWRTEHKLSQVELRDKMQKEHGVDIGETYVSELERTEKMPTLEVAIAMAKVLNLSLDYLGLLIGDAISYVRDASPHYFSEEADEAAQLIDKMRPDQRVLVATLVRNVSRLPTERQRRETEIKKLLDSVEKDMGIDARKKVEGIVRSQGLFTDSDS